jgi:hypothetical protein
MRSFLRALTFTAFALASYAALAEKPAKPAPQAKQELKMETAQLVGLIKSTIMALQHANQTGNYSVLRDLGTPVFRERFDQARLTAVFYNLRNRGINFTPILFLPANLTKQPEMTEGNELHVVGDFQTQPLRIQYDLLFFQIDGVWRINGMAVDVVPVQAAATAPAPVVSAQPPSGIPSVRQPQPVKPTASNPSEKSLRRRQVNSGEGCAESESVSGATELQVG